MSTSAYHLYVISFTVGSEAGLAMVAAGDERSAFQILKNGGSRRSEGYSLVQTRDIGMTASCSYGLLMESFVNAREAYDAIVHATIKYMGPQGLSAYDLAVQNGYEGTIDDWIASLKGEKGDIGITAGIGTVTVETDEAIGTPYVEVVTSGTPTSTDIHFSLHNFRGVPGPIGPVGPAVPLAADLVTDRPTIGLAASMGVQLKRYVDDLEARANRAVYIGDKIGTVD